jgi:hypothetical protein
VEVDGEPDVLQVVRALETPRRAPRGLDGGYEQSGQYADDRNDGEEFYERETTSIGSSIHLPILQHYLCDIPTITPVCPHAMRFAEPFKRSGSLSRSCRICQIDNSEKH